MIEILSQEISTVLAVTYPCKIDEIQTKKTVCWVRVEKPSLYALDSKYY